MKQTIWDEICQFFVKNGVLIFSLFMGTAAKIAIDSSIKRLSKREIAIKVVLSFFCGYLASIYMNNHGWQEQAKWGVPLVTLLGESIIMWIMGHSRKIIETVIFTYFRKDKDNDRPKKFGK